MEVPSPVNFLLPKVIEMEKLLGGDLALWTSGAGRERRVKIVTDMHSESRGSHYLVNIIEGLEGEKGRAIIIPAHRLMKIKAKPEKAEKEN